MKESLYFVLILVWILGCSRNRKTSWTCQREDLRFREGELGIPNSTSRSYPSRLRPNHPLFFMPWIAWSLFLLNWWNRLSPLSHYRDVKGPGFRWTYPTWKLWLYHTAGRSGLSAMVVCFTEWRFRHKRKRPLDSWNLSSMYVRL